MPNVAQQISGHNKTILHPEKSLKLAGCNCRDGVDNCVMDGHCLTKNVVYEATIDYEQTNPNTHRLEEKKKSYHGLCSTSFKDRYGGHRGSFVHPHRDKETTLASQVWKIKRSASNRPYSIKWKIAKLAPAYSRESRKCQLCLTEKTFILYKDPKTSLNKRTELHGHCFHYGKHRLSNW